MKDLIKLVSAERVLQVVCPEHEQTEIVEVSEDGQRADWCSRVAGRPLCQSQCLSPAMLAPDHPGRATLTEGSAGG